ncbi:MAG: hypothetical protein HOP15_18265 [Planctomycetes bacterium]|nr:hypothetical protein [Planctomycetota bacterium]
MRAQTDEAAGLSAPDPGLAFPAGSAGPRRPFRSGALRGVAYGTTAPELVAALPRWLAQGAVPSARVLKQARVFLLGEWIVKFFPRASLFGHFRTSRAVRSAERHFECQPIPSPRPLVAASAARGGPSLLVREYVRGQLLDEVWGRDAVAATELAPFLAEMTRRRVLHGDLHPSNLLWDGKRWLLLDVDGVRHHLHSRRRVTTSMWARLQQRLGDGPELRALHARCRELVPGPQGGVPSWADVERRARLLQPGRSGR